MTTPAQPLLTSIAFEIPTPVAQKIAETTDDTLAETALLALRLYHGLGLEARTTLNRLAEQHGITPAKTLRMALDHLQKDSKRLMLGSKAVGRPAINQDRDEEIYARIKQGRTHASVAAEYGISLVRIGQIVAKQRALLNEPPRTRRAPPITVANLGLDVENGVTIAQAAAKYNLTLDEVQAKYDAYRALLPANPNMLDRVNASRLAAQPPKPELPEVLTLKEAPPAPRKLAVIPPSMRNPELFAAAKPIKIPDPAKVDVSMFDPNNPDFAI